MTVNQTDEQRDFATLNDGLDKLLARLARRGFCPCCVAKFLIFRGSLLLADFGGDEAVLEEFDRVAAELHGFNDDDSTIPAGTMAH
jgi:hypothetical protein